MDSYLSPKFVVNYIIRLVVSEKTVFMDERKTGTLATASGLWTHTSRAKYCHIFVKDFCYIMEKNPKDK